MHRKLSHLARSTWRSCSGACLPALLLSPSPCSFPPLSSLPSPMPSSLTDRGVLSLSLSKYLSIYLSISNSYPVLSLGKSFYRRREKGQHTSGLAHQWLSGKEAPCTMVPIFESLYMSFISWQIPRIYLLFYYKLS